MRRLIDLLGRGRVTVLLEAGGALAAVAILLLAPAGGERGTARVELSRAAGTLSLANSRAGSAIFEASNMRPGQQASGYVTVTTGTLAAGLTLSLGTRQAVSGAGRMLEGRLQLVVFDVTDIDRPATVYAGPLAAMPATGLGSLGAGRKRDFLFVASLPPGDADNALQGATLAAAFTWTAAATAPALKPTPTPTPTPAGPVRTPVPPASTPTPPPTTCAPRKARIRISSHGRRILRVTVKVGRERAHRVKPRRRITVEVAGAEPARVKVTAKLAGGKRVVVRRRVRGC